MKHLIDSDLSRKVLFLGVSMTTKGGMTSVLVSYSQYIANMRFIPTWKLGNKFTKAFFMLQATVRTIFALIFNPEIQIIHIHAAAFASFTRASIFTKIAKKFGKKVILHEHAADFKEFFRESKSQSSILYTLAQVDALIVLSKSWKEYFTSIGVDPEKILILNNIVSPAKSSQAAPRDSRLHLLYLGEVSKRKGIHDLIECVATHKEELKGKLTLKIGGNVVDYEINEAIFHHSLQDIVCYEGWISGEKKQNCLQWADVYILPSYNEGLPIAILEAMANGKPIISTPVGGIPEVVKNGINGILVSPGDANNIFKAINHFITNPDAADKMGEESRKAVTPFYPENVFSALKATYTRILTK